VAHAASSGAPQEPTISHSAGEAARRERNPVDAPRSSASLGKLSQSRTELDHRRGEPFTERDDQPYQRDGEDCGAGVLDRFRP